MATQIVELISITDIIPLNATWEESVELLKQYCVTHEAAYYAAPREDFSLTEAIKVATAQGRNVCVIEDLS